MRRILLVDDEIKVLNALVRELRQYLDVEDLRIETFIDPFDALTRCAECSFDVVISDYRMPQMTGAEFLHAVMLAAPDTVRIMLSASTEFATVTSAINEAQVFRFIAKPWQIGDLQDNLRQALAEHDRLRMERRMADQQRVLNGTMSVAERDARLLEDEEPGLTRVTRDRDGNVIL